MAEDLASSIPWSQFAGKNNHALKKITSRRKICEQSEVYLPATISLSSDWAEISDAADHRSNPPFPFYPRTTLSFTT
jgi:hypothetical protein